MVERLCCICGLEQAVEWDRTKPDGQKLREYDITKLRALGFEPRFSLEAALTETYRWYAMNVENARR